MGIHEQLFYRLRSMRHFFMNTNISVFQSKHLNTVNARYWYFQNVVYHFCIFNIDRDIAKFVQISIYLKISKLSQYLISSSIFTIQKKVKNFIWSSSYSFFLLFFKSLNIRNQRRNLIRLSIPMIIGTPCIWALF